MRTLRTRLVVRIGRGTIDAQVVRRGRVCWAGAAQYDMPDDVADAIARLAAEASMPVRPRRLWVVLEPPLVQVRHLRGLPPVRGTALRALVAHQAGRFFRRNGKPLVTDAIWERRRRGEERIAYAAAAEEPWVEAIAAGARAAGLYLEGIRPHLESPPSESLSPGESPSRSKSRPSGEPPRPVLDLLSPAERARRRGTARATVWRLAGVAALLWAAAGAIIVGRVYRESRRIERELAALEAPAKAVIAARRRIGEVARMVETVEAAARERGAVLALASRIVAALPDSAYLTSLDIDAAGAGSLTGAAKQAAHVVAALERTGVVRAPALAGPAVREVAAGREWERFTVRFGTGGKLGTGGGRRARGGLETGDGPRIRGGLGVGAGVRTGSNLSTGGSLGIGGGR